MNGLLPVVVAGDAVYHRAVRSDSERRCALVAWCLVRVTDSGTLPAPESDHWKSTH